VTVRGLARVVLAAGGLVVVCVSGATVALAASGAIVALAAKSANAVGGGATPLGFLFASSGSNASSAADAARNT